MDVDVVLDFLQKKEKNNFGLLTQLRIDTSGISLKE